MKFATLVRYLREQQRWTTSLNQAQEHRMRQVNIHEAKTQLSRLVEAAAAGEPFVIAKAGRPLVKVFAIGSTGAVPCRLGFLAGEFRVPEDFDRMGEEEITALFADRR